VAVSGWRVLGVDACKSGWIGIALSDGMVTAHVAAGIGELVEEAASAGPLAITGIDIPIGLPDTGRRQADLLARKAVGPLWASVFMTPVCPALEAPDYATAADLNRRLAGEGISRQAFALQAKVVLGRDDLATPAPRPGWDLPSRRPRPGGREGRPR
jgi:predicted RNase H-like nuclease